MTPDLSRQNLSDPFRQDSIEEFRKALSNSLEYSDTPDVTTTIEAYATQEQLYSYLNEVVHKETLGDTKTPIKKLRLSSITVDDEILIGDLYQYVIQEDFPEVKPVTLLFIESTKSAIAIIPIERMNDLLVIKLAPFVYGKESLDPVIMWIQNLWKQNISVLDPKTRKFRITDPTKIPGIKRGSDLKKR